MPRNCNEHSTKGDIQRRHHCNQQPEPIQSPESPTEQEPEIVGTKKRRASLTERWNAFMERRRQNGQQEFEEPGEIGVQPREATNNSFPSRNEVNPESSNYVVTTVSNNNVETEVFQSTDTPIKKTIVITLDNSTNVEQINIVMNFKPSNEETPSQAVNNAAFQKTVANANNQEKPTADNNDQEEMIADNNDQEETIVDNNDQEEMIADNNDEEEMIADNNDQEETIADYNDQEEIIADYNDQEEIIADNNDQEETIADYIDQEETIADYNDQEETIADYNDQEETIADYNDQEETIADDNDQEETIADNDQEQTNADAKEVRTEATNAGSQENESSVLTEDNEDVSESIYENSTDDDVILIVDSDKEEDIPISSDETKNPSPVTSLSNMKRRLLENVGDSKKLRTSANPDEHKSNQNGKSSGSFNPKGLLLTVRSNPDGTSKVNYLRYVNSRESSPEFETNLTMLGNRVVSSDESESPTREEFKERVTCTKITDPSKYPKRFTVRSTVTKPSDTENLQVLEPTISSPEPPETEEPIPHELMMLTPGQRARLRIIEQLIVARITAQTSNNGERPRGLGLPGTTNNPNLLGEIISRLRPSLPAQEREFYNRLSDNCGNITNLRVVPVNSHGSTTNPSNPTMVEENISRSRPTATQTSGIAANSTVVRETAQTSSNTENGQVTNEMSEKPTFVKSSMANPSYEDYLDMIERHTCSDKALGNSVSSSQCDEYPGNSAAKGEPVPLNIPIKNYTYEEYLKILKARASANKRPEKSAVAESTKLLRERISSIQTERQKKAIAKEGGDSSDDASEPEIRRPPRANKSFPNKINPVQLRKIQAYQNKKKNNIKKNLNMQEDELSDSDSS